tara:strand:+ start:711 stop:2540 length:1830 start_codon:yes stop_codon:yes gene_type:complete
MDLKTATKLLKYSPSDVQRVRYVVEYANHNTDNPSEYIDVHTHSTAQKEIAQIFVETANAATLNMKPSDASPKIDTVKEKETTVDPQCENQKTIKAKPSEASAKTEEVEHIEEKKGLYANIHAKRERGESPAKPGDEDYPAKDAFKKAAKTAKEEVEHLDELSNKTLSGYVAKASKEVAGHMKYKGDNPDAKKIKQAQIHKRVGGMSKAAEKMAEAYASVYEKYDNRYSDNTGEESAKKKAALEKKRGMKLDNHPQFKREEVEHIEEQKPPRTAKGAMAYDGPNKAASEARDRVIAKTKALRKKKGIKPTVNIDAPDRLVSLKIKEAVANYNEELKMTKKEYGKIHKDFKSDDPKNPRTTKYVPGKGTVSMPVKFVEHHQKDENGKVIEHEDTTPSSVEEGKTPKSDKIYDKCWDGYKKVPGKGRGEKGSCVKAEEVIKSSTFVISETPKGDMGKDRATKVKDRSARSYGGSDTYGAKYNAPARRTIHDMKRGVKKDKGHVNRPNKPTSKFDDDRQGGAHWHNQGQGLAGTKKHGKTDYDEPSRKKVKKENYSWRERMDFDEAYEINVGDAKSNNKAYQDYMSGKKNKLTGKPLYKASKDYLDRAKGDK